MRTHRILAACLGLAFSGAFAAQQGALDSSQSTGSFDNTFNLSTVRQVQILGLQDALVTPDSGLVPTYPQETPARVGTMDNFCVVDTTGGAVLLTVTPSSTNLNGTPTAIAANGSELSYRLVVYSAIDPQFPNVQDFTGANTTMNLSGNLTVSDASNCGGGNMTKIVYAEFIDGVVVSNTLPSNGNIYTGSITISVTPQ